MAVINIRIIMIISKISRVDRSCFRCVDRNSSINRNEAGIVCMRKFIALRVLLNFWFTRPMLIILAFKAHLTGDVT